MPGLRCILLLRAFASCGRFGFGSTGGNSDAMGLDGANVDAAAAAQCAKLDAGRDHFCAIISDGSLACWGSGTSGQLGDGASQSESTPVAVDLGQPVVDVGGGRFATCAVLADGTGRCWGEGENGQLGDGLNMMSAVPSPISGAVDLTEVALGALHGCARRESGGVVCWGTGSSGRLGDGSGSSSSVPVPVANIDNATRLGMTGGSTICAIVGAGDVRCWGFNGSGQLGIGSTDSSNVPVAPLGLPGPVSDIAARDQSVCAAIAGTGAVYCWGLNGSGQIGNGEVGTTVDTPTPVTLQGGEEIQGIVELGAGIDHMCGLHQDGDVYCWGGNGDGQLGRSSGNERAGLVEGLPVVRHLTSAAFTNCALTEDGEVWCWGQGGAGQLGDGSTPGSRVSPGLAFDACP